MSDRNDTQHDRFKLSLLAKPGISIRLLDASLQEIARGSGQLETVQPIGLYLAEWSSAGQQTQTIALVDGKEQEVIVRHDPSAEPASARSNQDSSKRTILINTVNDALRLPKRAHGSAVVLIVSCADDIAPHEAIFDLRLLDREDVSMHANAGDAGNLVLADGEYAHFYPVKPGRYHIDFRSVTGERLSQTVPALRGRQTLVFLKAARNRLLVPDGGQFHEESNVGIDPARTAIVTVRGDEADYRVRERVRLASLLLFDLSSGGNSLSDDVVAVLDDAATDPLLKLYGAAVALASMERSTAASSIENSQRDGEPSILDMRQWRKRIRSWASDPRAPGLPPDALTAWWKLCHIAPKSAVGATFNTLPSRIEVPPMLECSWRWAIAESVVRPDAVRGTAMIAAASRTAGGTTPWLCWKSAAVKAKASPGDRSDETLPTLISQVATKVRALIGDSEPTRAIAPNLAKLSADVQLAALRSAHYALPRGRPVGLSVVRDLALALGLPSRMLRKRLVRTRAELDTIKDRTATIATQEGGGEITDEGHNDVLSGALLGAGLSIAALPIPGVGPLAAAGAIGAAYSQTALAGRSGEGPHEAPGLSRLIIDPNDTQKGRFGSNSLRKGFSLIAEFKKTRSRNWVRLILRVEGPAPTGAKLQFHLHESFKPSCEIARFKGGVAELAVTVWGGFTVGVWIPGFNTELELDIAQIPNAPHIIKNR